MDENPYNARHESADERPRWDVKLPITRNPLKSWIMIVCGAVAESGGRQRVQVRRLDVRIAVSGDCVGSLIVGEEDQDIRLLGGARSGGEN
jgi:hypothetical protein